MPMSYAHSAITEAEVPRASKPVFQHLLDTYASETSKVISVWQQFSDEDLSFRPHPRSSTVLDIFKHQLLSERRFSELVGVLEPPASEVVPQNHTVASYAERMLQLTKPRLTFFAVQSERWCGHHSSMSSARGFGFSGGESCTWRTTALSSLSI
jgi:hypothetical protein